MSENPNKNLKRWDGPLPSHLSQAQASRLLGISDSAVGLRVKAGTLPCYQIAGAPMVPTLAVMDSIPPALAVPFAYEPLAIVELAQAALAAADSDAPMFSPRQLLGCYLGLSRMPWPPALS
jgi:hypothetical protein